jgi:ABC-2 type transport system permease protein
MSQTESTDLSLIKTLVFRELQKIVAERMRLLGLVLQPLILWLVFSFGFDSGFGAELLPGGSAGGFLGFFFPGVLVMTILFGCVFSSMTIIDDRAGGFLQATLSCPVRMVSVVLGKSLGVMLVVLLQAVVVLAIGAVVLRGSVGLDVVHLLVWSAMASFALVPINLAVALALNSTQSFHAFMGVVLFPAWAFSGALFPVHQGALQLVALANPLTYMVGGLRQGFVFLGPQSTHSLEADQLGAVVGPVVLLLLGLLGVVLATFALRRSAGSL